MQLLRVFLVSLVCLVLVEGKECTPPDVVTTTDQDETKKGSETAAPQSQDNVVINPSDNRGKEEGEIEGGYEEQPVEDRDKVPREDSRHRHGVESSMEQTNTKQTNRKHFDGDEQVGVSEGQNTEGQVGNYEEGSPEQEGQDEYHKDQDSQQQDQDRPQQDQDRQQQDQDSQQQDQDNQQQEQDSQQQDQDRQQQDQVTDFNTKTQTSSQSSQQQNLQDTSNGQEESRQESFGKDDMEAQREAAEESQNEEEAHSKEESSRKDEPEKLTEDDGHILKDRGSSEDQESNRQGVEGSTQQGLGSTEDVGPMRGEQEDLAPCNPDKPGNCERQPFPAEEEEPGYDKYLEGMELIYSIDPNDKARGYEVLQEAAKEGNTRALEKLAYGYIIGSQLKRNFTRAFEIFSEFASRGNPIGQQGLGYMYSTGVGINSNQGKAVVNFVFGALGGHQFSQMAMGYRSHMGVGVVQSCESALAYYQKSADQVIAKTSHLSGGVVINKIRLMDEDDETPSMYGVSEDEIIHYQSIFTDSGNTRAQFALGIYYMFGLAGAQKDFKVALKFLQQAAESNFPAAHVLMGKIYLEGNEDVPQNFDAAYEYFRAAADMKYGDGYSGLGILYYNGLGVKKDRITALDLFQKAADRSSAEGHYYLGLMYFNGDSVRKDMGRGIKSFQLASHGGYMHAIHMLGKINAEGNGVKRSCLYAVELFKTVSERGQFTRMFTEAQRLYSHGDVDSSFLMYTLLAELGFEEAQSNVAYLLERGDISFIDSEEERLKRALLFWNRAAAQGYHQARVKLGDYYYYGLGTEVSYEAAATQYRMASDKLGTPQAMFNLGYMYEHGEGLEQDYHLAKRYYDMAAQTSSEAIVPVNMALFKMNLVYTMDHYKDWLDIQSVLGGKWDIYLMSLLAGCVVVLVLWRTRA